MWVLTKELASCHTSDTWNSEVTSNFFKHLCTPVILEFCMHIVVTSVNQMIHPGYN
jgi:hypothetical protein